MIVTGIYRQFADCEDFTTVSNVTPAAGIGGVVLKPAY
jgi:hypothetical protein